MKKLFTLSLVALLTFSALTACGKSEEADTSIVIEETTEVVEEETQAVTEEVTEVVEEETEAVEEETEAVEEETQAPEIEIETETQPAKNSISDSTNFKPITEAILKINENIVALNDVASKNDTAFVEFNTLKAEIVAFIEEKAGQIQQCSEGKINLGQDDVADMVKAAEEFNKKLIDINKTYDLGAKLDK